MAPKKSIETLNALPLPDYRAKLWRHASTLVHTHKDTSTSYDISLESPSTLSSSAFRACFDLIASTSSADYEASSKGWSPAKKRREMRLPDLRYLLLQQRVEDGDANGGCIRDQPQVVQGFVSFMLTCEDGYEVIYLYEIHLSSYLQGQGLGKKLMDMMEEIGRKAGVEKSMLTVFTRNEGARGFYEGLGYGIDEFSPRARKLRSGVVREVDYLILSKSLKNCDGGREGKERSFKRRKAV
ncbi:hypothetical protein N7G274_008907 [Stereocaulon virgatum]|uniref:N-alpha-acetyltransferase 40 n=1 Tax=Stereocaulon virgatum TaxID=373712 RepID=A0ABR4A4I1_9LECA